MLTCPGGVPGEGPDGQFPTNIWFWAGRNQDPGAYLSLFLFVLSTVGTRSRPFAFVVKVCRDSLGRGLRDLRGRGTFRADRCCRGVRLPHASHTDSAKISPTKIFGPRSGQRAPNSLLPEYVSARAPPPPGGGGGPDGACPRKIAGVRPALSREFHYIGSCITPEVVTQEALLRVNIDYIGSDISFFGA